MAKDGHDIWKAIAAHRTAMLTTLHGEKLLSRPMATYADEDAGKLYLITGLDTKTRDIRDDSHINLAYVDDGDKTYISVTGTARVSQDRAKLKALWNPWAQGWLPEGPEGADVALITIDPDEATIWDADSSRIVGTVKTLAAALTGTTPDTGTVDTVKL